jgi:hypothetical protein
MRLLIVAGLLFSAAWVQAGDPKEDFVNAVVKQCKKSKDDAEKLVTPGRTGTVVQFQLCSSPTVDVSGDCKLTCSKGGATIGD